MMHNILEYKTIVRLHRQEDCRDKNETGISADTNQIAFDLVLKLIQTFV
jgi:hypothetical protein